MNITVLLFSAFVLHSYSTEAASLYSAHLTKDCGYQVHSSKSADGNSTLPAEHPWVGTLIYTNTSRGPEYSPCTVVLISNRYAITAAACVVNRTYMGHIDSVRLGKHRHCNSYEASEFCTDGSTDFKIEQVIAHQDYNNTADSKNDIALLKLNEDVTFTDYIRPVCLSELKRNEGGLKLRVVDWTSGKKGLGDVKIQVFAVTVEDSHCDLVYTDKGKPRATVSEKQICATVDEQTDPNDITSGAPLLDERENQFFLEGIASSGFYWYANTARQPDLYTAVADYKDWINSHIIN